MMKKFKIAVIDTALNAESLPENIKDKLEIKNYFEYDNKTMHSSMVINTLLKYTDAALIEKIYLYNIFTGEKKGSGVAAVSALEDIIQKNDVNFLLMSVTLTNKERYEQTKKLCQRIYSSGITIIAADSNRPTEDICYPFSFDCVYGISQGAFSEKPFFCIDDAGTKHISGDASPEFICCGENNYCLFGGTSKAVPKFLAVLINAFAEENDTSCERIAEWIKDNALSEMDNTIRQIKENSFTPIYKKEVYDTLCSHISDYPTDLSKYGKLTPSFVLTQLDSNELYAFLVYILKKFSINTRPDDMRYTDFSSAGSLCAYIGGQI